MATLEIYDAAHALEVIYYAERKACEAALKTDLPFAQLTEADYKDSCRRCGGKGYLSNVRVTHLGAPGTCYTCDGTGRELKAHAKKARAAVQAARELRRLRALWVSTKKVLTALQAMGADAPAHNVELWTRWLASAEASGREARAAAEKLGVR